MDIPPTEQEQTGILQTAYEFWFPESKQSVDDLLSRRPTMTAEALARAQAKASLEGEESYADYLPDAMRLSLQGVETPLGATVRVVGDSIQARVD